MSTMHNNTPTTPDRRRGAFLKVTHVLLLIFLAGGLLLVVPASAQSTEAANTKTGSILGTVVDMSDDPVPDATVVLQEPADDPLTVVTNENGSFVFHHVTAGIAYQVTVTAEGFAEWASSVTVKMRSLMSVIVFSCPGSTVTDELHSANPSAVTVT